MSRNIEAIFLDTGNTMRLVVKDAVFQNRARLQLAQLVETRESSDSFFQKLNERYEASKKKSKETQFQVPEKELWTRWMLPDFPPEKIEPLAGRLTRLWIDQAGRRVPRADVKPTIIELNQRGYKLGIIANSISDTEIPDWLQADGLEKYFSAVALSSKMGNRKPDPEIYLKAAQMIGVDPIRCAYVGDNPTRDILGARAARYGMVVIILEAATLQKEPPRERFKPDGIIGEFAELLNLFPSQK
jgi:putative hydrolase of the HAD superfamily